MNAPAKIAAPGDNSRDLITAAQLEADFAHVVKHVDELLAEAAKAPPALEDDEDLAIINGIVPKLTAFAKRVDGLRDETKRPYMNAGNTVQTFFKAIEARILDSKKKLEAIGTAYLQKKAEAERQRRAEEERRAREEQLRREQEAAEAAKAGDRAGMRTAAAAAQQAEGRADSAAIAQQAKPAELARTTSGAGTATLVQSYGFEIEAFAMVDLEMLRPYLAQADVEKAIRKFVTIHKDTKPIPGVRIFATTAARFSN